MLPEYLFESDDGALYDTRRANWSATPLRADYKRTHRHIDNTLQLRATLRAGAYAWPGGYPMFFITSDGESLSFESVRDEYYQCAYSMRHRIDDGWRIVGCDINYEDTELTCDHSGARIPSAYGGDE